MNRRSTTECTHAPPPSARGFLAAFAGVALSFLGATSYSQYVQSSVGRDATDITSNSAPSVEHLGKARTELREVELLLYKYTLSRTPDRQALEAIAQSRRDYAREIQEYLSLPTFPGEKDLWEEVERDITPSADLIGEVAAHLERGDFRAAREILVREDAATERAFEAISRSLEFDVAHTRRLAESIEATRRHAILVERILDSLCVGLTLAAGLLLFRAVRHYARLFEAHHLLTERRAAELDQFSARVAHDILSPLGATGMALAIADKSLPEGSRAKEAIARGASSLARVRRIVEGLLEFARAGAQPSGDARAEVGPVVDDVVSDVRTSAVDRGIEVIVEPFPPCDVAASPGILTSLLANLLRNAVKYMGDRPVRRVCVRVRPKSDRVRFEVVDTGPGIPPHLLDTIFEPYVRGQKSSEAGIGLGLATVKRITQTHGGDVGVSSAVGRGSTFWFELPRPRSAAVAAREHLPAAG